MIFFRRKRVDFYELLLRQARKAEEGISALLKYFKEPNPIHGSNVLRLEEEADDIRRELVEELNKTFITPIDREDIYALSGAVDDLIDYAKSTVEEMMAFGVQPNAHMIRMGEGLNEAAMAIAEAIRLLPNNEQDALDKVAYAKKRENFVEHCYREALVDLFKGEDVLNILKVREIYRHMSNAADRGDEAANIIGNIVVKST